jgi:transcriptional regulator with XRE-family HTH domain
VLSHVWSADGAASRPYVESVDLGAIVAANVRGERAKRRWRQQDLAERLGPGWDQPKVANVEAGRREIRLGELPDFCRALDVPLVKLLDGASVEDRRALGV